MAILSIALNHSNFESTKIYTRLSLDSIREASNQFSMQIMEKFISIQNINNVTDKNQCLYLNIINIVTIDALRYTS